jgi:superfamily II DNA or RNA helicase|tara:strand:+ start:1145 stop:2587 length:1443 start_codon:yes stop_codon:yes gene_type:complete
MVTFEYDTRKRQAVIKTEHLNSIREHFSFENEGARFARRYGRYMPARTYVITPAGKYEVGLTANIIQYIKKEYPEEKIVLDSSIKKAIKPKFKNSSDIKLKLELRDYQDEIVEECVEKGRGVIMLATAGGKTLTMANLLERGYAESKQDTWKVLVIVPDLGLVNQTFSDFENYGVTFSFSKWTGNNDLDITSNVVIANLGILQSEKTDLEWIQFLDVLVIDECHKVRRSNKVNKIIKSIQTHNKFGFTGTLPDNNSDQWNIIGKIGPVIYQKRSYELRVEKYVTNAVAHIIKLHYHTKPNYSVELNDPGERYRQEFEFLFENTFRNNVIDKLTTGVKNNSLILVDYIKHGEALYEKLKNNNEGKQVYFIRGEVDVEERDKVKKLIERDNNIICIAISRIFSTGISINNLHYIVFASGGKAKIKILQSIGRGLRLHENKNKLVIIDIADQLRYGGTHSDKRLELYQQENINLKITNIKEKS